MALTNRIRSYPFHEQRNDEKITCYKSEIYSSPTILINDKATMYSDDPTSDVVVDGDMSSAQKAGEENGVPLGASFVTV